MQPPPPDLVDLGDVLLRRWAHADVPALTRAAAESHDHLRPWMAWATPESTTAEAFHRFVDDCTARATDGSEAVYGIFDAGTGAVLGGCGLHDRLPQPEGVEIGYWLHVGAVGRGLMTRAVMALTATALGSPGISRVEIHCDPGNHRSAAVAQRCGYRLDRVEPSGRPRAPADSGDHQIWVLDAPTATESRPATRPA